MTACATKDENKHEILGKAINQLLTDQIKLHASFQLCHFDLNFITQQPKVLNMVVDRSSFDPFETV